MFHFKNLNEKTRPFILQALEEAEQTDNIYFSKRFNEIGNRIWIPLLKEAALNHDEHWLAFQLEKEGAMNNFETARKPSGGYTIKHVPHTDTITISDGQFNRFYMLGLCKFAKVNGIHSLVVYRAKESVSHRSKSDSLIGEIIIVEEVESQLKEINSSFKSDLLKPNSGISLMIPD